MGVASSSGHGVATTSTATARDELPGEQPAQPGQDQGERHERGGVPVGEAHHRRLVGGRLLGQPDDPRVRAVPPRASSPACRTPAPALTTPLATCVAGRPPHQPRLAGHHRLVQGDRLVDRPSTGTTSPGPTSSRSPTAPGPAAPPRRRRPGRAAARCAGRARAGPQVTGRPPLGVRLQRPPGGQHHRDHRRRPGTRRPAARRPGRARRSRPPRTAGATAPAAPTRRRDQRGHAWRTPTPGRPRPARPASHSAAPANTSTVNPASGAHSSRRGGPAAYRLLRHALPRLRSHLRIVSAPTAPGRASALPRRRGGAMPRGDLRPGVGKGDVAGWSGNPARHAGMGHDGQKRKGRDHEPRDPGGGPSADHRPRGGRRDGRSRPVGAQHASRGAGGCCRTRWSCGSVRDRSCRHRPGGPTAGVSCGAALHHARVALAAEGWPPRWSGCPTRPTGTCWPG